MQIDELMNDSDMEFIAPEEIELTDHSENKIVLTPLANVHFADEGITHTKELETNKKRKKSGKKYPNHMETQRFSTFSRGFSFWVLSF